MSKVLFVSIVLGAGVVLIAAPAAAQDYTSYKHFPSPVGYFVMCTDLSDGRLLVWDGESLYLQDEPSLDRFTAIATGYSGDPAFIALSPDGHTVLLGTGYGGGDNLYVFDVDAPKDASENPSIGVLSHYWGAFLTADLVVIDRVKSDYSTTELGVFSLSGGVASYKSIIDKPAAAAIPAGQGVASSALAVDAAGAYVYAMDYLYDYATWALQSNQLRRVSAADLIGAYNTSGTLAWTAQTAIGASGAYDGAGPSDVTAGGKVLFGGNAIQVVDPGTGAIDETLTPDTAAYPWYVALYNAALSHVYGVSSGTGWIPEADFVGLPAIGTAGLLLLTAGLARSMYRRLR